MTSTEYDYGYEQLEMAGAVPAYSLEAEQAVLGALLMTGNPDAVDAQDVADTLRPEDFYSGLHQDVYALILKRMGTREPFDAVILSELLDTKHLSPADRLTYLVNLARNTPSARNLKAYAKVIRERSMERIACQRLRTALELMQSGEGEALERIERANSLLADITAESASDANHLVGMTEAVKDYVDFLEWRFENPGIHGLTTGLERLDARYQGWKPGDLVILAARPAMGKTTMALGIGAHVAMQNRQTLVFSLEMPRRQLVQRLMASVGHMPLSRLKDASVLSDMDHSQGLTVTARRLIQSSMLIDDTGSLDVADLRSRARVAHKRKPVDLIIVDYLQLMTDRTERDRFQVVSAVSRKLKALAKELGCVVLCLSQLSRKCEERSDKRPMNSDLRESGQIEQDADIITMLYRDEVYNESSERNKGLAEAITTKFRDGEVGTDYLAFLGAQNRFDNLSRMPEPPQQQVLAQRGFE